MRALVLVAVLAAAALVGCASDASRAQDTVTKAISALAKGDQKTFCQQLTPAAQRKLLKVLQDNPLGDDIHASTCGVAITKLYHELSKPIRAVLTDGEVDDAKITGDKAVVHVIGVGLNIDLQKIAGSWKITGGFL
ncbi:MAG TPA: hypothetical protein VHZ75_02825 [Solirubrobacteraceae bacterium]|jgi:hypothetical protein|nr:hypothetical protein [Solirubrobacteraceae bacterium]